MLAVIAVQHRGQDSAGMVTTAWRRFHEHRDNGLTSDVFKDQAQMNRLKGARCCQCICFGASSCCLACRSGATQVF